MAILFQHEPHPRIDARRAAGPPRTTDAPPSLNGRMAVTAHPGRRARCGAPMPSRCWRSSPCRMPCRSGGLLPLIEWLSQTFIQLVMLSVIMVGQNILAKASDRRADMTYADAEATFHEAEQIQAHLEAQDRALNTLLDKVAKLEAAQALQPRHPSVPSGRPGR